MGWFRKRDPWTSGNTSKWRLVRNENSWVSPQIYWVRTSGGPKTCVFTSLIPLCQSLRNTEWMLGVLTAGMFSQVPLWKSLPAEDKACVYFPGIYLQWLQKAITKIWPPCFKARKLGIVTIPAPGILRGLLRPFLSTALTATSTQFYFHHSQQTVIPKVLINVFVQIAAQSLDVGPHWKLPGCTVETISGLRSTRIPTSTMVLVVNKLQKAVWMKYKKKW